MPMDRYTAMMPATAHGLTSSMLPSNGSTHNGDIIQNAVGQSSAPVSPSYPTSATVHHHQLSSSQMSTVSRPKPVDRSSDPTQHTRMMIPKSPYSVVRRPIPQEHTSSSLNPLPHLEPLYHHQDPQTIATIHSHPKTTVVPPCVCADCRIVSAFKFVKAFKNNSRFATKKNGTESNYSSCVWQSSEEARSLREATQLNWVCKVCHKGFKHLSSLRSHLRRSHQNRNFISCSLCDRIFAERYVHKRHFLMLHLGGSKGIRKFPCTICEKKFSAPSKLKVHLRVHTGARPYPCDRCNFAASTIGNLNRHKRSVHRHDYNH